MPNCGYNTFVNDVFSNDRRKIEFYFLQKEEKKRPEYEVIHNLCK